MTFCRRHIESLLAGFLGLLFFAVSVGLQKIDPRNVGWIVFKDQRAHWVGWLFFAGDEWRWPLGANPRYGWDETNSIVNSDSWPIFAMLFKATRIDVLASGQYFGIALATCSVALFVGATKLFRVLHLSTAQSLVASTLLATTPLFWWMHRWYFALTGGLCLLIWATLIYFRSRQDGRLRTISWLLILLLAVGTNFYLWGLIFPIYLATLLTTIFSTRKHVCRSILQIGFTTVSSVVAMYTFGYFTMPVGTVSTGRYGIYTANLLGLFDSNSTSRWLPDLPSTPLQYEPTSVGIGSVIICVVMCGYFVFHPKQTLGAAIRIIPRHIWLLIVLVAMFVFSVSNYVTLGERGYNFEIHYRLFQLFSVFQSSARFMWPITVLSVVGIVTICSRWKTVGTSVLVVATLIQIADVFPEIRSVALRENSSVTQIEYEQDLWSVLPYEYERISIHPPLNIQTGWDECAYAAAVNHRVAHCAYLSRPSGVAEREELQQIAVLSGVPDQSMVYWLSRDWLLEHAGQMLNHYQGVEHAFVLPAEGTVARSEVVYFFPNCGAVNSCSFLGARAESLDRILRSIQRPS